MTDEEILTMAHDMFELAREKESDTRDEGLEDLKFARLGDQWPDEVRIEREREFRPVLTENRLPAFIRQVVNDVRQNKPAIVVHPADDGADVQTAEIFNGLIRNIQTVSDADVATDTAAESAVSNGFGYFRINLSDDGEDIVFQRVSNPFSVYGDPYSDAADSSDWDCALVVSLISKDRFEELYNDADAVDWDGRGYTGLGSPWMEGDEIMIAEYWRREPTTIATVTLSNGQRREADSVDPVELMLEGLEITGEGDLPSHKVTQYILSGAEVLETNEWPGVYIPIVPVYGDEINVEGRRYFRSLINPVKDAQRRFNYWLTAATEMVALAPRVPFIGEEGAFDADPRWATAHNVTHPYLEYKKGFARPERQIYDGAPMAMIQAMLQASDGMKAILGIYDASLGNRSNETSGVAIRARQAEGDVSTFHFIDNLSRSIRHAGRILIDLIPKVYNKERIVRVLGEDMKPTNARIAPGQADPMQGIYDLGAGKYDLVVKSGPSYTTQREQTRAELVEIIRSVPESKSILGPMYLRHSDWPGADKAADLLEQGGGGGEEHQQQMQAMSAEIEALQKKANDIEAMKAQADMMKAEADLIRANADARKAEAEAIQFVGQTATNPWGVAQP